MKRSNRKHVSRQSKVMCACLWMLISLAAAAESTEEKKLSPCEMGFASDQTIEWECKTLKKEDSLESLFGDRWQAVARFNRIDRRHAVAGTRLKVPVRFEDLEEFAPLPAVLQDMSPSGKTILIDLSEQFLGAYEDGSLIFSAPIASGKSDFITPPGEFKITAFSRRHASSLYKIEDEDIPYPMHYALQFLINENDVAYWIHGRDLPGYPASHGCVGLYDEEMQKEYYGVPEYPLMDDARKLFEWAIRPRHDDGELHYLKKGPAVLIIGTPPGVMSDSPNMAPGP